MIVIIDRPLRHDKFLTLEVPQVVQGGERGQSWSDRGASYLELDVPSIGDRCTYLDARIIRQIHYQYTHTQKSSPPPAAAAYVDNSLRQRWHFHSLLQLSQAVIGTRSS